MPSSDSFHANLDTHIAKFSLLCIIPTIPITSSLAQDDCIICHEPYRNNAWEPNGTLHRPVGLLCGHVFGLQCLARWMTSATSVNRCPLCSARIMNPLNLVRGDMRQFEASSFARLESLAVVGGGALCARKDELLAGVRSALLSERPFWDRKDTGDRIMVAWEEHLNALCKGHETAGVSNQMRRRPTTQAPARQIYHDETIIILTEKGVRAVLTFALMGMTYGPVGYAYDCYIGRQDTLTAMVLVVFAWIFCALILASFYPYVEGPRKYLSMAYGMAAGLMFCTFFRWLDIRLFGWWFGM